jgi:ABC-type glycerol-3-phosphate transport system substrate-binding protein
VYVADRSNSRVQIFDQDGNFIAAWKQFGRPSAVFIAKDDTLYVSDSQSNSTVNPGYTRGITIGSAKDGSITAFIPDPDLAEADVNRISGASGIVADAKGTITVNSDATRQVLEYAKRLVQFLPPDVFAWDDASNNKWLISGKGALIMNPPSAWAVAKRDNPKLAEQLWTFPAPKGPKGRYQPGLNAFWGIWRFSKNKAAARSLLTYLSERPAVEQLVEASGGYDIPSFSKLRDFKIWAEVGPPKGTLYHYPPAGDQIVSIPGAPAPAHIATQIFAQATMTKMIAKYRTWRDLAVAHATEPVPT